MKEKDFEYYLTKLAWEDPEFAKAVENDAISALQSKGITVPKNVKLRVIVQKKDTIYLSIPPLKKPSDPLQTNTPEEMDVWSSGNFFIWFAPIRLKFNLFILRNSVPAMEDE